MLTENDLKCLNWYPEGSRGYNQDQEIINTIHNLCLSHGFGRTTQIAKWIQELFYCPDKIKDFEKLKTRKLLEYKKLKSDHNYFSDEGGLE